MRAQQGASEGESDTGFPFFMSDFFMPDARRPAAPDVGNTGYLISEAYAAGSPVCLTPVSGVRRMSGTRCPWCAVSLISEAYAAGSPKRLTAVYGAQNAGFPNPDAGQCASNPDLSCGNPGRTCCRSRCRKRRADILIGP